MDGQFFDKQESIDNCTFVKAILMILVILYHSCVYWTGAWFDKSPVLECHTLAVFAKWLNSFHVYGFVLVSGYIYSFGKNEKGKYQEKGGLLLGKVKRLLVPFYFVVTVWVIPIQQFFFHNDIRIIIRDYILSENPNQLWFLWMLFMVFVVMSFVTGVVDRSYGMAGVIALAAYSLFLVLFGRIPNLFQSERAMQFLPVFIVGYYMRKNEFPHIPCFIWFIIDIVLFCAYEYAPIDGFVLRITHYWLGFLLHMIGAIMAFEALQTLAIKINWKKRRTIKTIASYSMPMYLFHQQIIYFGIVLLNGRINPWINAGINFAIALIGSFLISWILVQWKVTRVLIGG